jgi:hypothetical protein
MKYTKKQRKQIYLDALEILAGAHLLEQQYAAHRYACKAISVACGCDGTLNIGEHNFPEISAFACCEIDQTRPWLTEHDSNDRPIGLHSYNSDGNEFRQLVLIFAAELCDDKDF